LEGELVLLLLLLLLLLLRVLFVLGGGTSRVDIHGLLLLAPLLFFSTSWVSVIAGLITTLNREKAVPCSAPGSLRVPFQRVADHVAPNAPHLQLNITHFCSNEDIRAQ
jgi:hypothetical protein